MTPDESYQKTERLVKTKDFRRVFKGGRSLRKDFLLVKIAPNNLPLNRIGFSISAKILKKAYRRNRIRRLLREVFRKNKKALKKGFDMVLILKRDPGDKLGYNEAKKVFLSVLKEV